VSQTEYDRGYTDGYDKGFDAAVNLFCYNK
jgi:hypothetical protein